jgi:hypothetical protein
MGKATGSRVSDGPAEILAFPSSRHDQDSVVAWSVPSLYTSLAVPLLHAGRRTNGVEDCVGRQRPEGSWPRRLHRRAPSFPWSDRSCQPHLSPKGLCAGMANASTARCMFHVKPSSADIDRRVRTESTQGECAGSGRTWFGLSLDPEVDHTPPVHFMLSLHRP